MTASIPSSFPASIYPEVGSHKTSPDVLRLTDIILCPSFSKEDESADPINPDAPVIAINIETPLK